MANTTGKKFGGRKKGTQNKNTTALKTAILNAFEKVGGQDYLVRVAEDDPKTFLALLGKVLPSEVKADITNADGPTVIKIITPDSSND